jgi:hypothetical protein
VLLINLIFPRPRCRTKDETSICMMPVYSVASRVSISTTAHHPAIVQAVGPLKQTRRFKPRPSMCDSTLLLFGLKSDHQYTRATSLRLPRDRSTSTPCRRLLLRPLEKTSAAGGIMGQFPFTETRGHLRNSRTRGWRMLTGWCIRTSRGSADSP